MKRLQRYKCVFIICIFSELIFLLPLLLIITLSFADTSNKWRIEVSGGANSDGEMIFGITPEDGEGISIRVTLKDGTGENRVAKTIRDAFK